MYKNRKTQIEEKWNKILFDFQKGIEELELINQENYILHISDDAGHCLAFPLYLDMVQEECATPNVIENKNHPYYTVTFIPNYKEVNSEIKEFMFLGTNYAVTNNTDEVQMLSSDINETLKELNKENCTLTNIIVNNM